MRRVDCKGAHPGDASIRPGRLPPEMTARRYRAAPRTTDRAMAAEVGKTRQAPRALQALPLRAAPPSPLHGSGNRSEDAGRKALGYSGSVGRTTQSAITS